MTAILYLITFGSLVGYSAYVYVMDKLPVAIVSIYPYVNAVVAVALGWLFYREPFGWRETAAMLIIFAGVAVVKRYSQKRLVARSAGLRPTNLAPSAPPAMLSRVMKTNSMNSMTSRTVTRPGALSSMRSAS